MPAPTLPRLLAVCVGVLASLGAEPTRDGPVLLSGGDRIEVKKHLAEGKTVIFSFFSAFSPACPCEPCHGLGDPLAALQAARDDLVVVKVDINRPGVTQIDWSSPVAMQFALRSVPHFKVFGPDGKLVAEDDPQERRAEARERVHTLLETLTAHGPTVASRGP